MKNGFLTVARVARLRFAGREFAVKFLLLLTSAFAIAATAHAATITNGGFESDLDGWRPLWTRDARTGTLMLDRDTSHSGKAAALIEHRGENDWSFEPMQRLRVQPGNVFELSVWLKLTSDGGSATVCVSAYDSEGRAVDWSYGERSVRETTDWRRVQSRLVIPEEVVEIQPRVIGHGKAMTWVDDYSLEKKASLSFARRKDLPAALAISNKLLSVTLNTSNATLAVLDRRTGQLSEQKPLKREIILLDANATQNEIKLKALVAVKKSGLKYMMFETSCFHEDLHAMREIYKAGGLDKLVYAEGEYYHYMAEPIPSYKDWRVGLPPQWYPTHSNAYYSGVSGGSFTEVSCAGMTSVLPHLQSANNRYKNPFGTEIALFRTSEGGSARMAVSWDTPGDGGERGRIRGQRGSFYGKYEGLDKKLPSTKRPPLPPNVEGGGHGGSHGHLSNEFISSILQDRKPLVDVALALNMTVAGIVAHQSALKDGELMKIPQFRL